MSVQLILAPQNVDGYNNGISSSGITEILVNGSSFDGVNTSVAYVSTDTNPANDIRVNAPATVPNTWYKFRSVSATAIPTVSGNVLNLNTAPVGVYTGVYQQMTNLVVGQVYQVTCNLKAASNNTLLVGRTTEGVSGVFNTIPTGSPLIRTTSFIANGSEMTIYFYTVGQADAIMDFISFSVIGESTDGLASGTGQVICDLYEDEDLPLTLSVEEFKNVAEKVQSYSKAFNLPATKRNNRIFDNIFEITRADDGIIFNPYIRTQCILKQDGFIIFEGYLRLIDASEKNGEVSYNVNLYSEVIALADVLKDKAFRDINLNELNHAYNYNSIKNSWNTIGTGITYSNSGTSGFRDANSTLKYPFVDWNHQYTIDSFENPVLPNLESTFRPFIQLKYLINRIFEDTPFTYTSNFFSTIDFEKLYMDFNWGSDIFPSLSGEYHGTWFYQLVNISNIGTGVFKPFRLISNEYPGGASTSTLPPNYQGDPALPNPYIITATGDNEMYTVSFSLKIQKTGAGVSTHVPCRWLHTTAAGAEQPPLAEMSVWMPPDTYGASYLGSFTVTLQTGDTLVPQFNFGSTVRQNESSPSSCYFTVSGGSTTSETLLSLRGELGQWEFLKGLITMFNLVTMPDEDNPNNILIEPYVDVFTNNTVEPLDWTTKVDVSEMKLKPLTELNKKTIFKFTEDDDDYAFQQYKKQVGGHLYGSKKVDAGENFNILDSEEEIVAEPFAATVVKSLMSQYPDFIVPSIYSYNANDDTSEGFENSPRIMYNNYVQTLSSNTYNVPSQNCSIPLGCGNAEEATFLQFSHLTSIETVPSSRDFHFGECQLMQGVGDGTVNNLYNIYWEPYFNELYNTNTRIMTLKVDLNAADINEFKFNSEIYIKNRTFRVNKIDYKPNDLSTVEFILIP